VWRCRPGRRGRWRDGGRPRRPSPASFRAGGPAPGARSPAREPFRRRVPPGSRRRRRRPRDRACRGSRKAPTVGEIGTAPGKELEEPAADPVGQRVRVVLLVDTRERLQLDVEIFDGQPAAGTQDGGHALERKVPSGHMAEDEPRVHEIELVLGRDRPLRRRGVAPRIARPPPPRPTRRRCPWPARTRTGRPARPATPAPTARPLRPPSTASPALCRGPPPARV
jgi:hypothetical protein